MPRLCLFILWLKNESRQPAEYDCCGNSACGGSQTAGQDSPAAVLKHGFLDAICERITETGQRNRCAGTGKIHDIFVNTQRTKDHTGNHI